MTANDFREMALSLPETEERSHWIIPTSARRGMSSPRSATQTKRAMVKLSAEQQHCFSKDYPDAFIPVKGAWGRRGATSVV